MGLANASKTNLNIEKHNNFLAHIEPPSFQLEIPDTSQKLPLEWERGRCFDKEVAVMFLHQVKTNGKQAKVISITTKEKAKERPMALNTVELMRVASSGLGMGPHHAMQIAEKLYIQGYISYPRTESTHYADSFDLKDVLRQQQNVSDWGQDVRELLSRGINRPKKGEFNSNVTLIIYFL